MSSLFPFEHCHPRFMLPRTDWNLNRLFTWLSAMPDFLLHCHFNMSRAHIHPISCCPEHSIVEWIELYCTTKTHTLTSKWLGYSIKRHGVRMKCKQPFASKLEVTFTRRQLDLILFVKNFHLHDCYCPSRVAPLRSQEYFMAWLQSARCARE